MKRTILALFSFFAFIGVVLGHDGNNQNKRDLEGLEAGLEVIDNIADILKDSLMGVDDATFQGLIAMQYMKSRLMDYETGAWLDPALEEVSEALLPPTYSVEDAKALVDEVAAVAKKNNYLVRTLKVVGGKSFPILQSKRDDSLLPEAIANAVFMQQTTKAIVDDWTLMKPILNLFMAHRDMLEALFEAEGGDDPIEFFLVLKGISVDDSILKAIRYNEAGAVDPNYGEFEITVNIAEAAASDISRSDDTNAKTGTVLQYSHSNIDGTQPPDFSSDGKAVEVFFPEPKLWNDLYTTWNLGFVLGESDWFRTVSKLLIPIVNDYEDAPAQYIYKRAIALWLKLHESIFGLIDDAFMGNDFPDWLDPQLKKYFSRATFRSARGYAKEVGFEFF